MTYKPFAITPKEFKEIAASEELQEMWGVDNAKEMEEVLASEYIARFNFTNESPGYVGDLFVIQSDCLDTEIPAIRMIRGLGNQLVIIR